MDEWGILQIRDAVLRYQVVVLRDQELTAPQQAALMSRLYPLREVRKIVSFNVPECPIVTIVSNIKENGKPIGVSDAGQLWHTDQCYTSAPELFVSLYAIEVPHRDGHALGDTLWASTLAAYDELDETTKSRLSGLTAVQSYRFHQDKMRSLGKLTRKPLSKEEEALVPDVEHPIVRTHPITGRRILYVNESFSAKVSGLSDDESTSVLQTLWTHIAKPQFAYRHSWRKGDLVLWDNCATQHLASFDYGDIPRHLHRCGTKGPIPQ